MNINKTLSSLPTVLKRVNESKKYEPSEGSFGCIISEYFTSVYNGDIDSISNTIPTCKQCSRIQNCNSAYGEEVWNKFFGIVSYYLAFPLINSHYYPAELSLGKKIDFKTLTNQYKKEFELLGKYYLLTNKLNRNSFKGICTLESFLEGKCKDSIAPLIAGEISQYFYVQLQDKLKDEGVFLDTTNDSEVDLVENENEDYIKIEPINIDTLIGLKNVKTQLNKLKHRLEFSKKMSSIFKFKDMMLHTAFTGNPGVGKSMVAQWYADTLHSLGYIRTNKVVFAKKSDLIAGYIGQTPSLTQETINKALGGVLFIDEAYTLLPRGEKDFAHECIDTLIANMTEKKHDLVVIFAGYSEPIKELLSVNPGLQSRVPHIIEFEDYTNEELLDIMKLKLKSYKLDKSSDIEFTLSKDLELKIKSIFDNKRDSNFGNARFAENLLDYIIGEHSEYCIENGIEDLDILTSLEENTLANYK